MSRFGKPAEILKPDEPGVELGPAGPGDDWLSRVNLTINNFKELVKLAQQLRGEQQEAEDSNPRGDPKPPARTPGVLDYVQLAIKAGYGDTPIGKLIEEVSPHTLNQIMEIVKNARSKR